MILFARPITTRCFRYLVVGFLWITSCWLVVTTGLQVIVSDTHNYRYHVEDAQGNVLFRGGDIAFFVQGKWCVYKPDDNNDAATTKDHWDLVLQKRQSIHGTDATLGQYSGEQVTWLCQIDQEQHNEVKIETVYKNMESGAAVLFEVHWPDGATNTTTDDYKSAMTNYPSLVVSPEILPDALSWQGSFTQSVRGYSEGTVGGPTLFYNGSDLTLETVIMASPWSNWKAFSAGNNQNWRGDKAWSPGTSGRITMLPKGYRQSIILYQGNYNKKNVGHKGGITATMSAWGQAMQQSRKPANGPFKIRDVTLEKIGYQTDNGAMYCFCPDTNCSQTLLNEIEYLKNTGIPMGYLSFQGAGASSGRGQAAPWCIDIWGVDGGLSQQYPMDLTAFQKALGLPLQLYAPYFCPGSPYFDAPDHRSQWKAVPSDTSLPGCNMYAFQNVQPDQSKAFYGWFLDKGHKKAGMVSFETDFMNQNYNCVPDFIQNATAAETWQRGMAGAALERNIPIQWCYAAPTDILASLDMPAVTNFRVSFDFCYGGSWNIGESSLLVWALGAFPSKDTLWSTDNNRTAIPGCPWTPDHEESAAELHVVLALMTKGPVGISDAIGYTNATLLKRIIRQDGTLLQPGKSITAVDSTFLSSSQPDGYVYGTAGLGPSWYFVSFLLQKTYTVKLRDFWPLVPSDANQPSFLVYRRFGKGRGCHHGADAIESRCVRIAQLSSINDPTLDVFEVPSAPTDSTGERLYTPTVTSVWQPCTQSGWILLGELKKYVPLSPRRFTTVECTPAGVSVSISGDPGEVVELTALRSSYSNSTKRLKPQYIVVVRTIKIAQLGATCITFASTQATSNSAETRQAR